MPTPKEWQDDLERIREFSKSIERLQRPEEVSTKPIHTIDSRLEALENLKSEVRETGVSPSQIKEVLKNPPDSQLAQMSDDIILGVLIIKDDSKRRSFVAQYLKGLIVAVTTAWEVAEENVSEENDPSQNTDI